ncbi:MAG: haloacid dehalogenase-like hydrolase [Candidatus Diapherotrites archaeon]
MSVNKTQKNKAAWAVAFDIDCVITKGDMINFISENIGKKEEGNKWEKRYHELMFDAKTDSELEKAAEEGLRSKYHSVLGLDLDRLKELIKTIPLTERTKEALDILHKENAKIILVSATLLPIAKDLAEVNSLPVDHYICSTCNTKQGKIGKTKFILTPKKKGEQLATLLKDLGIPLTNCFAVGDSISEKYMFELVGKGNSIGFNCRAKMRPRVGSIIYEYGDNKRELLSVAKLIIEKRSAETIETKESWRKK